MTTVKRLLFILAPSLLLACAAAQPQQTPQQKPQQQQATLGQIKALVGTASCSAATECASLPLGATPCGGPEGYLPWSTSQTKPKALLALAERYKAEREAVHANSGIASTCRMLPDPGATCDLARHVCTAPSSQSATADAR